MQKQFRCTVPHIQPNTRTLNRHCGLPHLLALPARTRFLSATHVHLCARGPSLVTSSSGGTNRHESSRPGVVVRHRHRDRWGGRKMAALVVHSSEVRVPVPVALALAAVRTAVRSQWVQ